MHVIDNTISDGLDRAIHEPDADFNIIFGGAKRECLEQKHGAGYDAEVCAHGGVLEEVVREEALDNCSEEIARAFDHFAHVFLVAYREATIQREWDLAEEFWVPTVRVGCCGVVGAALDNSLQRE